MENKRGTTVLLTVIGIATLLVAVVGATFAYFTATVKPAEGNVETDVTITAAQLGTITFTNGTTIDLCDEEPTEGETYPSCAIYPGAKESKEFKLTSSSDTTGDVDYEIYLVTTTNSIATGKTETPNLVATLTSDNAEATSELNATPLSTTTYSAESKKLIGSGTLGVGETDTWNLEVELKETGLEQNDDQGRQFVGKIVVEAATKYTVNGTEYTTTVANAG